MAVYLGRTAGHTRPHTPVEFKLDRSMTQYEQTQSVVILEGKYLLDTWYAVYIYAVPSCFRHFTVDEREVIGLLMMCRHRFLFFKSSFRHREGG